MQETPPRPHAHDGDFSAVVRSQLPQLYALARALAGGDAEDALQECLLNAYRSYHTLTDRRAAPAWLRQILCNCVRDWYRHEMRQPRADPVEDLRRWVGGPTDPLDPAAPDDYWTSLLGELEAPDLWAVLDRLEPRDRIPLVLVHMEGRRTREVAALFGVAHGTVLSWLHRGQHRFKRELAAHVGEGEQGLDAGEPVTDRHAAP